MFTRWIKILCLGFIAIGGNCKALAKTPELVLNDPTAPPFTNESHAGLFDIVVGEAFKRVGLRLVLVKLPAERGLINANSGIDDGDLSRIAGIEKTYPNLIRVPEKIFDMDFVAFTLKADSKRMNWQTLQPFSVGFIKGWKIFERNLKAGTEITTAEGPEQLIEMLKLGRVQYALYSRWMGLAMAQHKGIKNVRVAEPALAQRAMFIYLNKRHAAYVQALAKALREIKREGMYTRVCKKLFSRIASPTSQCQAP
jgi:polar amino acid transport system substrate-binding protein